MRPDQAIGNLLYTCSAVTAITTLITHGIRASGTAVPAINFYQLGGTSRFNGVESPIFSINCRATDAGVARGLGDSIVDLFGGTSGTGIYGTSSTFSIARGSVVRDNGLIPEPDSGIYNASIDVRITFSR